MRDSTGWSMPYMNHKKEHSTIDYLPKKLVPIFGRGLDAYYLRALFLYIYLLMTSIYRKHFGIGFN